MQTPLTPHGGGSILHSFTSNSRQILRRSYDSVVLGGGGGGGGPYKKLLRSLLIFFLNSHQPCSQKSPSKPVEQLQVPPLQIPLLPQRLIKGHNGISEGRHHTDTYKSFKLADQLGRNQSSRHGILHKIDQLNGLENLSCMSGLRIPPYSCMNREFPYRRSRQRKDH